MSVDLLPIIEDYKKLLIAQYADKPKANAQVALTSRLLLADGVYWDVQDAYNVLTAVGVQLDVLGKYVGITRDYDGSLLNDDDYRFLMKLKIVQNYSNNSAYEIVTSLNNFFGDDIVFIDNKEMSISYFIKPSAIATAEIAKNKKALPKPVGVNINLIEIADYFVFGDYLDDSDVFGFGFADYADAAVDGGDFIQYNDIF